MAQAKSSSPPAPESNTPATARPTSPDTQRSGSQARIIPAQGERALAFGQSGSGKTNFAVWLLERLPLSPIVIYDTKIEPKFAELKRHEVATDIDQAEAALEKPEIDYVVFQPVDDDPEALDELLGHHYANWQGIPAYIDEVGDFQASPAHPGPGLRRIYRKGRSKGITVIAGSQRPAHISPFTYSEAQHFYVFRLQLEDDRKKVARIVPGMAGLPNPPRYHFYYNRAEAEGPARLMKPVPLVGGDRTRYTDIERLEPIAEAKPSDDLGHVWIGTHDFLGRR